MIRSFLVRLGLAFAVVALFALTPANAQYPGYVTNSDDTGMPSYGAFVSSSIDTVNLLNQGLILQIPLMSRKSRGFDSSLALQYESKYWVVDTSQVPIAGTALFTTYYHWRPDTWNGLWANVSNVGGSVDYSGQIYTLEPCPYDYSDPPTVLVRSNWVYIGPDRTKYQLPLRKTYGVSGFPGCWPNFEVDNLVGHTDQGHILVDITNDTLNDHSGIKITREDGTQISLGTSFLQKDTNGNYVSDSSYDTLGRQLGTAYTDSNGNPQAFSITNTTLNITTAFPTTSYDTYHQVVQYSGSLSVISQITLPNGLSYTFSYDDPNNPGHPNPFGEVTKVTLPTGGYIKYKWGFGGDPGPTTDNPLFTPILDSRILIEKDVSEDGSTEHVWTYVKDSQGVTVTDPLGNKEIHALFSNGNCSVSLSGQATPPPVDPGVEYLDASGRVLKIVAYDYCFDYGPVYSAQQDANLSSTNQNYTYGLRNPRIIRTTVTLPDTGQVSKTETDFNDTYTYQVTSDSSTYTDARLNPTETREYDYGSGAPGSLVRKTDTSYWHNQSAGSAYLTGHIWNRVFQKDVYDGPTSTLVASTQYNYDSTTISSTSSVIQHDTAFNTGYTLRGNVTQIKRLLTSTGTWLTTTNSYNDVGNLVQTTDPGGHTYTLSYADNFTDGANHNSQGFLTSVTGPTTNVNHIEGKQYYWNTGLTAAVCGQNAPSPSACVNTYSPSAGSPIADYAKYTYDALGRPLTVTHGDGGTTSFSFTEPSSPSPSSRISVSSTSAIDSSTNLTNSVVIDGLGRVIETQLTSDPAGTDKVDTLYDEVGRVHSVSNPYRSTGDPTYGITTNVYDGAGRVTTLIPPDGSSSANNVTTVYSGNSITVTDQAGKQRRSFSDALGRLIEVDEPGAPSGATVSNGYAVINGTEQTGGGTSGTDSITFSGVDQSYQVEIDPTCNLYDCSGNCLSWSNGSRDGSPTFTTVYDQGNVSVVINGHTFTWGYGQSTTGASLASNFAGSINGYSGSVVNASSSGAVLYLTSKTHTTTAYTVSASSDSTDTSGNIIGASYGGTPATATLTGGVNDWADTGTVSVTVGGVQASVTYGSGSTAASIASALASGINASSSELVTASASGGTINFTDKSEGAPISISTASSSNFPTVFLPPSFTSVVSDEYLNATAIAPPNSMLAPAVTLYTYDALNNLICVEQHGNVSGTGCSAAQSNDASSAWRIRRFVYDSLGRMTSATNPESGTSTFTYDSDGNVLTKTSPKPNQTGSATVTTTLTYDALHRVLTKSFNDSSTPSVTIAYDGTPISGCSPTLTAADPIGRRTAMCDAAGWEAWSYDSRGHVIAERRSTNGVVKSTAYAYNFHGGVKSITYPSGRTINYAYNPAGQTLSATDTANNITYASNAQYNAPGALTSLQEGSNLVATAFYTPRLQPCRISVKNTGTAPSSCGDTTTGNVMDLTYGFNFGVQDNGNAASITNNINTARSQTYTYDELNRVSTAQTTATSGTYAWGLSFGYDPWANLLSTNVTQGSAYALSVTADGSNRIHNAAGTFTYDAAGNLTSDPTNSSYTYNAEGELTSAAGVTYTYDGDGDRVQKSNGKLYWFGLGTDPLSESDASGNLTNEYIFLSGARIAMLQLSSSTVNYYIADHLGSSRIVTNSSGTVLDDSDFYPFGGERPYLSSSGNNYKFTGKERDTESGLDDFAARFYTSNYGRFLSPDDSKYVKSADPQTWNLYGYVANNPINSVDPTGHSPNGHKWPIPEEGGNIGLNETTQAEDENNEVVGDTIADVQQHEQAVEAAAQAAGQRQQRQQQLQNQATPQSLRDQIPHQARLALATLILDSNTPTADDTAGGFHEEYGVAGLNEYGDWMVSKDKPGAYRNPDVDRVARPSGQPRDQELANSMVDLRVVAHAHPGGKTAAGNFWNQPPSDADRAAALPGVINIVFGVADKVVYFFNSSGQIGNPMTLKDFLKR
jgi:RHS repeat-associated protein